MLLHSLLKGRLFRECRLRKAQIFSLVKGMVVAFLWLYEKISADGARHGRPDKEGIGLQAVVLGDGLGWLGWLGSLGVHHQCL